MNLSITRVHETAAYCRVNLCHGGSVASTFLWRLSKPLYLCLEPWRISGRRVDDASSLCLVRVLIALVDRWVLYVDRADCSRGHCHVVDLARVSMDVKRPSSDVALRPPLALHLKDSDNSHHNNLSERTIKVTYTHDELASMAEIRNLQERYCRGIDRTDPDLLRTVYWEEAIDEHGSFRGDREEYIDG